MLLQSPRLPLRWYDPPQTVPRSRGRQYAIKSPAAQPGVTRGDQPESSAATDFELGAMVTPAFQSPRLPPPAGPNPLKSPRLTGASPKCSTRVVSPRGPQTKPALDPLGLALSAMYSADARPARTRPESTSSQGEMFVFMFKVCVLVRANVLTTCRPAGDEEWSDKASFAASIVRYSDIHEPAIGELCTQ